MVIVTSKAPMVINGTPTLSEDELGRFKFKASAEMEVVPAGSTFKVLAVHFESVLLTSKDLDMAVSIQTYNAFFKESDIEV